MDFENEKRQEELSTEQNTGNREGYQPTNQSGYQSYRPVGRTPRPRIQKPRPYNQERGGLTDIRTMKEDSVLRALGPLCRVGHLSVAIVLVTIIMRPIMRRVISHVAVISLAAATSSVVATSLVIIIISRIIMTISHVADTARATITMRVAISPAVAISSVEAISPAMARITRVAISPVEAISSVVATSSVAAITITVVLAAIVSVRPTTIPMLSIA